MNRDEAIKLLKMKPGGVEKWNLLSRSMDMTCDLSGADLSGANLEGTNLRRANLRGANLRGANLASAYLESANLSGAVLTRTKLPGADLSGADLNGTDLTLANLRGAYFNGADLTLANLSGANLRLANLSGADVSHANLSGADLSRVYFEGANLRDANLSGANLKGANLSGAYLSRSDLNGADLSGATCMNTVFASVDFADVTGLASVSHLGPSTIGTDTLLRSKGQINEAFLRGCGLAKWEILASNHYRPELTPSGLAEIQYRVFDEWTRGRSLINGCFVSYSRSDANFVDKIRERLLNEGINVWLDRHDMVAGTMQDQVWRAIQSHHVVILVLSENSVKSDWVENELEMARKKEKDEGHAVLCPIALDDAWKAKVSANDGPGHPSRQLWRTLEQKLIIDLSRWKTKAFDSSFEKLLRGLKKNYGPQ